jgi:hypothetical protein
MEKKCYLIEVSDGIEPFAQPNLNIPVRGVLSSHGATARIERPSNRSVPILWR